MADWLYIPQAVQIMAKRLALSIGAAGAALCEACASGSVRFRWRDDDWPTDGFIVPIRTMPGGLGRSQRLTRHVWSAAHIDRDAVVSDCGRYELVQISRDDLEFWLSPREHRMAAATKLAESSIMQPQTNRRGRSPRLYWGDAKREALKWLDENGSPRPGTGEQAQLEAHVAGFLTGQEPCPSESRVRDYVVRWIAEFKSTGRG